MEGDFRNPLRMQQINDETNLPSCKYTTRVTVVTGNIRNIDEKCVSVLKCL